MRQIFQIPPCPPKPMIATLKDKAAEALHVRGKMAACLAAFASVAKRKLSMLDAAAAVEDLRTPPGNRLESFVKVEDATHKGMHRTLGEYREHAKMNPKTKSPVNTGFSLKRLVAKAGIEPATHGFSVRLAINKYAVFFA